MDLTKELAGFRAALEEQGAWFDPALEFRVEGSDVGVFSRDLSAELKRVIRVPLVAMPVLDDFEMTAKGDVLTATPKEDSISEAQLTTMDRMLGVYNALGKLDQWKAQSPWFTLAEAPETLAHLLTARNASPRLAALKRMAFEGEADALAADTFLGARKFNVSEKNAALVGRDARFTVLLPMIDYFNHRMTAQGFSVIRGESPPSIAVPAAPDAETGELFVRYNAFDAVDTYLYYGFVDVAVGYLLSVPLILRTPELRLRVGAGGGMKAQKLAQSVQDLRLFMPGLQKLGAEAPADFAVSKLVLPGPKAPRALRRVLIVVLNSVQVPKDRQAETLLALEDQLIEANTVWWDTLLRLSEALPPEHALRHLAQTGQDHVARYREIAAGLEPLV